MTDKLFVPDEQWSTEQIEEFRQRWSNIRQPMRLLPGSMTEFRAVIGPEDDVFAVDQLMVPHGHTGLFVMKVPPEFPIAIYERLKNHWNDIWRQAGAAKSPVLLIISGEIEISPLYDAELHSLGLMRIPTEKAE